MKVKILAISLFILSFGISAMAQEKQENRKVWGTNVPAAFMIYIVNPELLAGWPSALYDYEAPFIPEKYRNLPVVGSWHGGEGGIPDKEMLMKLGIKRAFMLVMQVDGNNRAPDMNEKYPEVVKMDMEIFSMPGRDLNDYINMLRELGRELDVPERGEKLAQFAEGRTEHVKTMLSGLKEEDKPRVYLAEWSDGLQTSCNNEVLNMAGGRNVFECEQDNISRVRKLSFEQIMVYDPDVIIITDPRFAGKYKNDERWLRLRAAREGKLLVAPFGPFGWLDKPAIIRIMGVQWMACALHPDRCDIDLRKETSDFMELFLHQKPTEAQLTTILER